MLLSVWTLLLKPTGNDRRGKKLFRSGCPICSQSVGFLDNFESQVVFPLLYSKMEEIPLLPGQSLRSDDRENKLQFQLK